MPVLQRRNRRAVEDEDAELSERPRQRQRRDDSESGDDGEHDADGEASEAQLVKKMVRYALACDYSRIAMKREGIRERVLGAHGRAFKRVFDGAQKQLRDVFGMEMEELPVRDKDTMSLGEKRKAIKSQTKSQASSNAWILVTRLPVQYRTAEIIAPSKVPRPGDDAAYVAIYTLIISVITLNGGSLSDVKLRRYLQRMNASDNTPIDKTDSTLLKLIRQGYIIKTADKRPEKEEETITWTVGPRGKLEVDSEAIASFVREVYGDASDDLERKLQASLRIRAVDERDDEDANREEIGNGESPPPAAEASRRKTGRRSRRHDDE